MSSSINPKDFKKIMDLSHWFNFVTDQMNKELEKFCINGNKQAAKRAREHLQEIRRTSFEMRKVIQQAKNAMATPAMSFDHRSIDDDDLALLLNIADYLGVPLRGLERRKPRAVVRKIAEHLEEHEGMEVELVEKQDVLELAKRYDLKLSDLVGTGR